MFPGSECPQKDSCLRGNCKCQILWRTRATNFLNWHPNLNIFFIVSLATDTGERKEIIKCTGNGKSSSTLERFFLCTDLSTGHT